MDAEHRAETAQETAATAARAAEGAAASAKETIAILNQDLHRSQTIKMQEVDVHTHARKHTHLHISFERSDIPLVKMENQHCTFDV